MTKPITRRFHGSIDSNPLLKEEEEKEEEEEAEE